MIYGNINNLGDLKVYPKAIAKALEYLKEKDFINMEPGKIELEGKDLYVAVSNSNSDIIENKKPETHNRYLDIQFSPTGGEIIGFATDTGNNPVLQDLSEEKDVIFYKSVENEKFIKMEPNDFFIFFPWDIHRPGCTDREPSVIRKVVVKINMDII